MLVGWLLARGFIGRINRVIDQTTRIASGDLSVELFATHEACLQGDVFRELSPFDPLLQQVGVRLVSATPYEQVNAVGPGVD